MSFCGDRFAFLIQPSDSAEQSDWQTAPVEIGFLRSSLANWQDSIIVQPVAKPFTNFEVFA